MRVTQWATRAAVGLIILKMKQRSLITGLMLYLLHKYDEDGKPPPNLALLYRLLNSPETPLQELLEGMVEYQIDNEAVRGVINSNSALNAK